MTRVADIISLERLCEYSSRAETMITVDAPLYGSFQVLDGKVLPMRHAAKTANGPSSCLPSPEEVARAAPQFWLQDRVGVRDRKSRQEMAALLDRI